MDEAVEYSMEERLQKLAKSLMKQNPYLSEADARTWVELLWEDFEVTRAKAGREYQGQNMTESIVKQWIKNYGPKLHEMSLEKWKEKIHRRLH
jgi:hypothetical protein